MENMSTLAASTNESTIALSAGEGVTGILEKIEPLDPEEVSFAYSQPTEDLKVCPLLCYHPHTCATSAK